MRALIRAALLLATVAASAILAGCSTQMIATQPAPTLVAVRDTPEALHTWSFDDRSGENASDSAAESPTALELRGSASRTAGVQGSALSLHGEPQEADSNVPDFRTADSYSVSAWVNMSAPAKAFQTFVSEDPASGQGSVFYLQYDGPKHAFAFSSAGATAIAAAVPVSANRWYHLVGVRDADADSLHLYVDGKLAATRAVTGKPAVGAGAIVVGRASFKGKKTDFVSGAIDDVRLFAGALDARQVAAVHAQKGGAADD